MSARQDLPRRDRLPVRVFRLGEEPRDDLMGDTTAEQRFEMVAMLSARMTEFSSAPLNVYSRHDIPVRVFRR